MYLLNTLKHVQVLQTPVGLIEGKRVGLVVGFKLGNAEGLWGTLQTVVFDVYCKKSNSIARLALSNKGLRTHLCYNCKKYHQGPVGTNDSCAQGLAL